MRLKSTFLSILVLLVMFGFNQELLAQQQSPLDVALRHLEENSKDLQLTETDLTNFRVSDFYTSRHNGVSHVYLTQKHQGIEVYTGITNVNVLPNGKVLNMTNRFVSNLAGRVNATQPSITPEQAIVAVVRQFLDTNMASLQLQEKVDRHHFVYTVDGLAKGEVLVNLVYEVMDNKAIRLSWQVELQEKSGENWWNARIDAVNGNLLDYHNQVIHCDFGRPGAGECQDASHSHNHQPAVKQQSKTATKSNSLAANSYNVFPIKTESPNHGDRELVLSPSDPVASPFGWHDTDGASGAEYTITRGNNVHAYHDIFNQDQSAGDEPDGGASLDFDYPLDLTTNLPYTQVDPIVVNLFYWMNLMHDVWYKYGFDEESGNFQFNNYGNGGLDSDQMNAEALDGSGTNNANFSAGGSDGNAGRIQMYVWTDDGLPNVDPAADTLIVTAPSSVIGRYEMTRALFGDFLPNPPIAAEIVLADDGVDVGSDICEDIVNGMDLDGKIALIDRGGCQFGSKALRAENAGAIAVIICNNVGNPTTIAMQPGADGGTVTIPTVMVSLDDCNTIRMGLPGLMVEFGGEETVQQIPLPGPNGVTGDFDSGIIAHEYTHGISIRLTGGPNNPGCLNTQEQAGEGWSDWFGLVMTTDSENTAEERRGIGTYALGENTNGDGIRTYPYSRDMNIDPHTYADIQSEAIPHGVGSVWCVMIWDLFWDLVDEHGWDDDIYNGTGGNNMAMQLVVDGLKMQGCNPSFIEARDAILAADVANYNGENQCLIWATFARRGLGVNASAGGQEDFNLPDICLNTLKIRKTASVEEVDAGGIITYTLEIVNDEPNMLSNIMVQDQLPNGTTYVDGSGSCPNTSVSNGVLTIDVGTLATGGTLVCTYQLQVADDPFSYTVLEDGIENGTSSWTSDAAAGPVTWETNNNSYEGDVAWYAEDVPETSDQLLTMVDTFELIGANPALSFWHWYDTEATWDGGVVEISTDFGANWQDLGNSLTQNGYTGDLQVNPDSPISGRPAFHGNSGGYIQTIADLSAFSGQSVMIRFRFGCDGAVGGNGWYVDNVAIFGELYSITNVACLTSSSTNEGECSEVTTIVNGELGVGFKEVEGAFGVNVFPNPSSGKVFVEMKNEENSDAVLEVMSIDGKLLLSENLGFTQGTHELNLSNFTEGIYLLKIQTNKTKIVKKVVIQ